MKVLITLSYYLPNISGLTNYVKYLSAGLAEKGNKVTILTSRYKKNLPKFELINKTGVVRVWSPLVIGRGVIMPTYFIEAFKYVNESDIVNVQAPQFEGFVTSMIAWFFRKKLLITYHCDLSLWGGTLNILSTSLVYISNLLSCILADKVVVNSEDYARSSWFLQLFTKKLVYVYPPVRIGKAKGDVLKEYKNVKYRIGYVGRLSKEKGVSQLLDSVKYLKKRITNFKLFLVGPVDEVVGGSQKSEISQLLSKYKDYIIEIGKLSEGELFGFYKEIDCLVLPSIQRQESFGMVQVEAMLLGCPVVATDLPGVRDPIKNTGMGIIVPPANSIRLSDAVITILQNRKKYLTSKENVKKVFDSESVITKYEKIFKGLLKE